MHACRARPVGLGLSGAAVPGEVEWVIAQLRHGCLAQSCAKAAALVSRYDGAAISSALLRLYWWPCRRVVKVNMLLAAQPREARCVWALSMPAALARLTQFGRGRSRAAAYCATGWCRVVCAMPSVRTAWHQPSYLSKASTPEPSRGIPRHPCSVPAEHGAGPLKQPVLSCSRSQASAWTTRPTLATQRCLHSTGSVTTSTAASRCGPPVSLMRVPSSAAVDKARLLQAQELHSCCPR